MRLDSTIKKGRHRCNILLPKITRKTKFEGYFKFKGDVSYNIGRKQTDSNKIFGLSDNWHHHWDSIRIGWGWNSVLKIIDIVVISYVDEKREIKVITRVNSGELVDFEINITDSEYQLIINGIEHKVNRTSCWSLPRYLLLPYFGGEVKAPKDFNIELRIEKNGLRPFFSCFYLLIKNKSNIFVV